MFICCVMASATYNNYCLLNITIMCDEELEISEEVYDTDFDDAGFEPEIEEGDNDAESAELYGY